MEGRGVSESNALMKPYRTIWDTETKPDSWRDTILIQLNKPGKDKTDLNGKRHIHTKEEVPKYFGHMVASAVKPILLEGMSPLQIGGIEGHRAEEHLFTIKSFLLLVEKKKEAIGFQLLDLSKMFDKESLLDCLNEVHKSNVKGKLHKLLYEMNKDTRITVRTAVGDSDKRLTGENMAQGSFEGAIISSVALATGTSDFF